MQWVTSGHSVTAEPISGAALKFNGQVGDRLNAAVSGSGWDPTLIFCCMLEQKSTQTVKYQHGSDRHHRELKFERCGRGKGK
jgi:hypothetical protein